MPSNKNQHFVPRCYLRPSTLNWGNAAINIFNVHRDCFVENAPVKSQCSRDYFYGKDELLERAIRSMEEPYGPAMTEMHKPGYYLHDAHRLLLGRFLLFQHLRTEEQLRRTTEAIEGLREMADLKDDALRVGLAQTVRMAMHIFSTEADVIDDLKICLLRNRTAIPFVTSDHPAIFTNRWYSHDRWTAGRASGVGSAGALFFLPLSPKIL